MSKMERRTVSFEVRGEDGNNSPKIKGHAAVFNAPTTIRTQNGAFTESIAPGAFEQAIKEDDVRALFNHDQNYVLGRKSAGTLQMSEDQRGLAVEIDPPPTQWANDLMISMRRGDINQMSFGFIAREQSWEKRDGGLHRTIKRASLNDVSPVTFGAYTQTDVSVRSAQEIYDEFEAEERAAAEVAALAEESLKTIDAEQRSAEAAAAAAEAQTVPSEPLPAAQPEPEPTVDYEALAEVQRKRLQLLG